MTAHIAAQRADHSVPIATSCRALSVSVSWFYKHWRRPPTATQTRRTALDARIDGVFAENAGEYGSPRMHAELVDEGWTVGVNTVAQRMTVLGLVGKKRRLRRSLTKPDPIATKFPNLLKRDFNPAEPNVAWCGDITEVKTWEGKVYVATVIDLYSRRLLGWAIGNNCKAPLVCDAMKMAIAVRGGDVAGALMHTDRGSQYTSKAFIEVCRHHKILQSMSRSGSCLDNAVAEAFFATLKTELVYRSVWPTKARTRHRLIVWFDRYNRTRRHSHCAFNSPMTYEADTVSATGAA